ncbi:hypothetical protein D3OALGA1CA_5347 [Olavius algarvensis associated proteobacterium Delta 3]|nr:hypothetical protein D3OALGB2SA_4936 [Olavius algarvensis associated proteobacterium Delta 3]CAB5165357.1 hypothetical protein D3OALGA1CA_5347 [Olavius algarvensis associated proteobacterium Delta 3]
MGEVHHQKARNKAPLRTQDLDRDFSGKQRSRFRGNRPSRAREAREIIMMTEPGEN